MATPSTQWFKSVQSQALASGCASSKKGFVLWHGYGWKGPNDRTEFRVLHSQLRRAWGEPLERNPNFRWQTFGPYDFEHRTKVSGFHPDNCVQVGAASHDDSPSCSGGQITSALPSIFDGQNTLS